MPNTTANNCKHHYASHMANYKTKKTKISYFLISDLRLGIYSMLSALDTTKHLFVPQNLTPFPQYTISLNIQIQILERERERDGLPHLGITFILQLLGKQSSLEVYSNHIETARNSLFLVKFLKNSNHLALKWSSKSYHYTSKP